MRLLKSIGAAFLASIPTVAVLNVLTGIPTEISPLVWVCWTIFFYIKIFKPPAIEKDVSVHPQD